ncbi:MAG: RrF2 family transcriptional regulator [Pikeienuella sp.]
MQLTKFSDYALRILIHLAATEDGVLSARDIAQRQGLSTHHLAKIGQWLAAEGYVTATRGRGGGMRLAQATNEISLGALLRRSEVGAPLVECHGADSKCVFSNTCGLSGILGGAQEAFFAHLDGVTLSDVMARNVGLAQLARFTADEPGDGLRQ